MVKIKLLKSEKDGYHKQMLIHSKNDAFVYTYTILQDCVDIFIESYASQEDAFHDISFFTEWHIKQSHPKKILVHCDHELNHVLKQNGYYPKGKEYQKIIDSYRLFLNDNIFDEEGYIIDQGSMQDIPFGWFDTARKGCGWIAVYNLLKANGIYDEIQIIIQDLEKHNLLGKVFGQEIFGLIVYLKQRGLDVFVSMPGIYGCKKALENCSSGILAYNHTTGGHYACFTKVNEKEIHFYNAIYRKKNHIVCLEDFLKQNVILHGCILIGIRKRA